MDAAGALVLLLELEIEVVASATHPGATGTEPLPAVFACADAVILLTEAGTLPVGFA